MIFRNIITLPYKALEDREVWNILERYDYNPLSASHLAQNLCRLESLAFFTSEIEALLMEKGIPFNRDTEETFEAPESHLLFRPGETPDLFEYEGNTASVPADVLWAMAENPDIDIRRELRTFLDEYAPRLESLEKAAEKWDKRQTGRTG